MLSRYLLTAFALVISAQLLADQAPTPPTPSAATPTAPTPPTPSTAAPTLPAAAPTSQFMSQSLGVHVFPSKGQDSAQQQQDEATCFNWAKGNTGFDPLAPPSTASPPQQSAQQPPPNPAAAAPRRGAVGGAAAGAAIGAIAGDAGKGAAIGATAGALSGAAARRQGAQAAQAQQQQQQTQQTQQAQQQLAAQKANYNRAFSECLEGKGYTVR